MRPSFSGISNYEEPGFDEFEKQASLSDLSRFAGIEVYNRGHLGYRSGFWESLGIHDKDPVDVYATYPSFPNSYYTVNPSRRGKALLVGDSFTPALRFDLARHVGEVLSVDFNQAKQNARIREWFDCVFNHIRPDCIIFSWHNIFFVPPEFVDNFYLMKQGPIGKAVQ